MAPLKQNTNHQKFTEADRDRILHRLQDRYDPIDALWNLDRDILIRLVQRNTENSKAIRPTIERLAIEILRERHITAPMIIGAIKNNLEELDEELLPFYKSIAKSL